MRRVVNTALTFIFRPHPTPLPEGEGVLLSEPHGEREAKRVRGLLYFALLLIAPPLPALAGAWLMPKGETLAILNTTYFESDQFFDANGDKQDQNTFTKYELNAYAEHGMTEDWTVCINLFLSTLDQDVEENAFLQTPDGPQQFRVLVGQGNIGFTDPELFARYRLYQDDDYVFSLEPVIKFPSVHAEGLVPKGGGEQFDFELAALGAMNFQLGGRYHFADLRLAYRHRGDELEDQLIAELQLGLRLTDSFMLIPGVFLTESTDLPTDQQFAFDGRNDFDLLKLELTGWYDLSPQHFVRASAFAHVDGKNTGDGEGVTIGYGWRF